MIYIGMHIGNGFEKLAEIFHTLGSPAALKILNESDSGLKSGRETINRLRLTPRAYYRNLEKLRSLNMIQNSGSATYILTPTGRTFRKMAYDEALPLLTDDGVSSDSLLGGLLKGEITIIDSCELHSKILGRAIEQSQTETLMAMKCFDMTMADKIAAAGGNGVRLKLIFDGELDLSGLFRERKGVRGVGSELMNGPHKKDYRIGDVPLSFTVIDHRKVVFEVPTEEFNLALKSSNRKVVESFTVLFQKLWDGSRLFQAETC
jgi:DNA-binding transcriptional ArsR family regulator